MHAIFFTDIHTFLKTDNRLVFFLAIGSAHSNKQVLVEFMNIWLVHILQEAISKQTEAVCYDAYALITRLDNLIGIACPSLTGEWMFNCNVVRLWWINMHRCWYKTGSHEECGNIIPVCRWQKHLKMITVKVKSSQDHRKYVQGFWSHNSTFLEILYFILEKSLMASSKC